MPRYRIGLDIGSTSAKAAVLSADDALVCKIAVPTGWSGVEAAGQIASALKDAGISVDQSICIATGYGRVSVPFALKTVTEITCHGRGAVWLHDRADLVVIDIGGQDTKIIRVEKGRPSEFLMNDKCSAGTGRFLEIMGNVLGLRPADLSELARTGQGAPISSLCTVFAESEVISLIGRGEKKENIAHSIIESIADKVAAQASRLANSDDIFCLTGGLCGCAYLREVLERKIGTSILAVEDGKYAGAIGAALSAKSKMCEGQTE